MSRDRIQTQSRAQSRVRGRVRTQQMRAAYDELDLPEPQLLPAGPAPDQADLGLDDDADADVLSDDGNDDESSDASDVEMIEPITEEAALAVECPEPPPPATTLGQLFGSRIPRVSIRLQVDDGNVRADAVVSPRSANGREALAELAALAQTAFDSARPQFSDQEWAALLEGKGVSLAQRFILLCRVAVKARERIQVEGQGSFRPSDRMLLRFQNKIAALPDGTPFALGLLLGDDRGRKGGGGAAGRSGLADVPDAMKLLGLRRALKAEQKTGTAQDDAAFGRTLREALASLGIPLRSNPTDAELTDLRERFNDTRRKGKIRRFRLFPNRRERQRRYDAEEIGYDEEATR